MWSDSQIVLSWLSSEKVLQAFVQNRIKKIKKIFHPSCWKHCPSNQNPADLARRGVTPQILTTKDFWFHGPRWLVENEEKWLPTQHKAA